MNSLKAILLMAIATVSCSREDGLIKEKEVQFTISNASNGNADGRISSVAEPKSVIVTLKNHDGTIVVDRKALELHKFGDNYLSLPVTLKVTDGIPYHLTEFFVTDQSGTIAWATPQEGSELAHLVNDPLDILFDVSENAITTVTPEVLEVSDTTDASRFGYGQFGFALVEKIDIVLSSFIKGEHNFELTPSHVVIEAFSSGESETPVWTYAVDLEAKANKLILKKAPFYRVYATKPGYKPYEQRLSWQDGDALEIFFLERNLLLKSIEGDFKYGTQVDRYDHMKFVVKYDQAGRPIEEKQAATRFGKTDSLWRARYFYGAEEWPNYVQYNWGNPPFSDVSDFFRMTYHVEAHDLTSIQYNGHSSGLYSLHYATNGTIERVTSGSMGYHHNYGYDSDGDLRNFEIWFTGTKKRFEGRLSYHDQSNVYTPHLLNFFIGNCFWGFDALGAYTPFAFPIIVERQNKLLKEFEITDISAFEQGSYSSKINFIYTFDSTGKPTGLTVTRTQTSLSSGASTEIVLIKNCVLEYY